MTSLILLACGLLIPAYLRAVDVGVIQSAGKRGPALLGEGQVLMAENRLGTAQLLFQAARIAGVAGGEHLEATANQSAKQNPIAYFWGSDSRAFSVFENVVPSDSDSRSLTDFIVKQRNRDAALAHLQGSQLPVVQELWRSRSLTNTVLFPPSQSAAGQAYDTAFSICGLLLEGRHLNASLSNNIQTLASVANRGASSQPLEQVLMDFLSLGVRFNWDQLTSFVAGIPDAGTLHQLADQAQRAGNNCPCCLPPCSSRATLRAWRNIRPDLPKPACRISRPLCVTVRAALIRWWNYSNGTITPAGKGPLPRSIRLGGFIIRPRI
jgi:hypothetical protein